MKLSIYNYIYLISNILTVYTKYIAMGIFFERKNINKKREFISYLIYYIVSSIIYLCFELPLLNILSILFFIFIITFNYKSTLKKKAFVSIFIYILIASIETIVVLLTSKINLGIFSKVEYSSIFGKILNELLAFFLVELFANKKSIGKLEMPSIYWTASIIIPLLTLYFLLFILMIPEVDIIYIIIGMMFIFLINFSFFFFYREIQRKLIEIMEQEILKNQNKYYENELYLMKDSLDKTKKIRHDINNHLLSLNILAKEENNKEIENYISDILKDYSSSNKYSNTGNIVLDSMVNFKMEKIEKLKANFLLNINCPEDLFISNISLTSILGNLFDNAITALKEVDIEDRYFKLNINFNKGIFNIYMENSFDGIVKVEKNKILTKKSNSKNGQGLDIIRQNVEKYSGVIEINYNKNFSVEIYLYN